MKRLPAIVIAAVTAAAGLSLVASPARAAAMSSGYASTATTAQTAAVDAMVVADGVRLRSSAGGTRVIGYLYYGDYGQILSSSSGWCRFRLGGTSASGLPAGTTGWASCAYLAREDGLRSEEPAVDTLQPR
ncbi:hypothetical protein GCM10010517_06300 [Streptosporangium fragile]|uniref:SH3 domain-containing protein n=1 Tax=Streptosporangium fragile TaxID=46186 RepID=A0ABN3VQ27_9ACTN